METIARKNKKVCRVDNQDCGPHYAKGLCAFHWRRERRGTPLEQPRRVGAYGPKPCSFEGCDRNARVNNLCPAHNHQRYLGKNLTPLMEVRPCVVPSCPHRAKSESGKVGLCKKHYALSWRFSLSEERLIEMLKDQECSNDACTRPAVSIDHDHACCDNPPSEGPFSCGECVRGMLCRQCNTALGMVQDSPEVLHGLARYLERFAKR